MARILIVEDDENLRLALQDNLEDEGYSVEAVARGEAALQAIRQMPPDLVILDIMLPDIDGYTVCRKIREQGHSVRVLMLTARTLENDLIEGFDAGADDYLPKPYRLRELLARIGALLRRSVSTTTAPEELSFGGFRLSVAARTLQDPQGRDVQLTRTELDLLICLVRHAGKALSRDQILAAAWDPGVAVEPRTVDNFVSSLKKKLGWTKAAPYRIKTVRGVGYRMEIDQPGARR